LSSRAFSNVPNHADIILRHLKRAFKVKSVPKALHLHTEAKLIKGEKKEN